MTSCYISSKKIQLLEENLKDFLVDDEIVKHTLKLVSDTLNFSEEKYAEHLKVQCDVVKRYQQRKKENGENTYSETKRAYYHNHKEEIQKKRADNFRKKQNAHVISI